MTRLLRFVIGVFVGLAVMQVPTAAHADGPLPPLQTLVLNSANFTHAKNAVLAHLAHDALLPQSMRDAAEQFASTATVDPQDILSLTQAQLDGVLSEIPTQGQQPELATVAATTSGTFVYELFQDVTGAVRLTFSSLPTPGIGTGAADPNTAVVTSALDSTGANYVTNWTTSAGNGSSSTPAAAVDTCGAGTGGAKCTQVGTGVGIVIALLCPFSSGLVCALSAGAGGLMADGACSGACPLYNVATTGHSCTAYSCTVTADSTGAGTYARTVQFEFFFNDGKGETWGWFVNGTLAQAGFPTDQWRATATPNYGNSCQLYNFDLWYYVTWNDGTKELVETGGTYTKPTC